MSRKLFVLAFLVFSFVFSSAMFAKEEGTNIEFLVFAQTTPREIAYEFTPTNYMNYEAFESNPLLTFHVPASQKNSTLFFELWAQALFKWSDFATRRALLSVGFRIISDDIPNNIDVENGAAVIVLSETNFSGDYDTPWARRSRRNCKMMMRRDAVDYWQVKYKDTGVTVPENIAKSILKGLIANGFDVEVYTTGGIQGSLFIGLYSVEFEVTRISR